ncbi:uncharacterized protein AMSG_11986 [Thecamonas trahens ATCC 50062]|uniref:Transglycosylase SLT domain-containing protein n=1 Tax=Thecamonas trahens ATCC 50062 TaxID=461836 RepID=A0A0L0DGD5_THETB|nr:hypothetical protein AMSG_11986 [Thecamonas trahens ATCC 50062]KNC51181.1 hypothetical protein AMSG_11986 [Thecamonas trahens ATCC 50062]|eukprot:XP_013756437.1 hypothetical protein AMSG_11986 [Thecamonas trahens ATCC 50062]
MHRSLKENTSSFSLTTFSVMKTFIFLAVLALCASAVLANTCGGNCPSNDCTNCLCGTSSSYVSISEWCAKFSGWDQSQCQCIVHHESSGNAHAQNHNTNGSNDIGVWQINSVNWGSCSKGRPPCDASSNLACAIQVWKWGGKSFRLWSTCSECGAC